MTAGPVLRQDLLASMTEENGAGWVELSDPASGKVMLRLAEDDFVVLCGLDGSDLGDLAQRARERLGLSTTVDDLKSLSARVAALGLFEGTAATEPAAPAPRPPVAPKPAPALVVSPAAVVAPAPVAPTPAPRAAAAAAVVPPPAQPASAPRRPPPDLRGGLPKVEPPHPEVEVDVEAPLPAPVTRQPAPYQPPVAAAAARSPAVTMIGVGGPTEPPAVPAPAGLRSPAFFDLPIAEDVPPIQAPRGSSRPPPGASPAPAAAQPVSSPRAQTVPPPAVSVRPTAAPPSKVLPTPALAPVSVPSAPAEVKETRWLLLAILVGVGLVGGGAAYWFLWRQPAKPVEATGITIGRAQVADVDTAVPGEGLLADVPPAMLSFQTAGKIAELVPPGQKVKLGDQIASLDGLSKLNGALEEVRGRLNHYQNELMKAERTKDEERRELARSKIDEKKKMISAFEKRRTESVLIAPMAGTVEDVAKVGAMVKAGQVVAKLVPGSVHAELSAAQPMAAIRLAGLEEGKEIRLVGGPVPFRARIEKLEEAGGSTRIIAALLDPPESAKAGTKVHASKATVLRGAKLPATAVFDSGGQSAVMTVRGDGTTKGKPVKVLERVGKEVLVDGLGDGEKFVVFGGSALRDGTRVSEVPVR